MNFYLNQGILTIENIEDFSLERSAKCGQAFRFTPCPDGFRAVIECRAFTFAQSGSLNSLSISNCVDSDIPFFMNYLDLSTSYTLIEKRMSEDETLAPCIPYAHGIRVFNQEPFETLISFIISANSNISKITSTIEKLCTLLGRNLGDGLFAFPTASAIAGAAEDTLRLTGAGYRVPYIISTARAVEEGFDLKALMDIPLPEARKRLCTLMGVGPKVADCVLLFSLKHRSAFPMDVWMKRAVKELYFKDGAAQDQVSLDKIIASLGDQAGLIQQYIFHYARMSRLGA